MSFLARNEHTPTAYVQRIANLRFLAEGRRPAKSGGNPELDAMMLASVHKPPHYVCVNPGGNSQYISRLYKPLMRGTRTKISIFHIASYRTRC
jgi:hypothetical protein